MGRKETASGLVGGMIAFVTYVWQTETAAFFDSIVPNAGYYAVRIVFAIAALYAVAVVVHWSYSRRKSQGRKIVSEKEQPQQQREPESQSTLILGVKPDLRLEHIRVHVFWLPFRSRTIKRQDDFPTRKHVVNKLTHKAFSVGDEVWPLLVPWRRIEINSETIWLPCYRKYWAWRNHLTIIPDKATIADLLEGTNLTSLDLLEGVTEAREFGATDTERQKERMEQVYAPLHSAVVSMREGKSSLRQGYTVGTPFNAWSKYPEIMQRIIDIFSKYPNLVENESLERVDAKGA